METRKVVFDSGTALELKAIAVLIQKASAYRSSIWVNCGDRRANAKSLLGVMSLRVERGQELEITTEGPDAKEALEAVAGYLEHPDED